MLSRVQTRDPCTRTNALWTSPQLWVPPVSPSDTTVRCRGCGNTVGNFNDMSLGSRLTTHDRECVYHRRSACRHKGHCYEKSTNQEVRSDQP